MEGTVNENKTNMSEQVPGDNVQRVSTSLTGADFSTPDFSTPDFSNLVTSEFLLTLRQMINEFDLAFDYIPKTVIGSLRKYLEHCESDSDFLGAQMKHLNDTLKMHEIAMYNIAFANRKIRMQEFEFLDGIVLFDSILNFNVFKEENKNTKCALVKYVNTMYMAASFYTMTINSENVGDLSKLTQELNKFVAGIAERVASVPKTKTRSTTSKHGRQQNLPGLANLPGMGNVFDTVFSNPDMMNMVSDITKELSTQRIDPMSLVSGLLMGKPSPQINNLVNSITQKIETKITNGEIDVNALEQQASNIMNAVGDSDLASQIPMLGNLLNTAQFDQLKNSKK